MAHRPPSATTSFTFAPKQKQKQAAWSKNRGRGGRSGHDPTEAKDDGGDSDGDDVEPPEEVVVCSFMQSSKVVDAWMQEATKGWKTEDKAADRKASRAAEEFSASLARGPEESHDSESARRIGSRAGLGAEAASRKRRQEALAKDENRKRIFGGAGGGFQKKRRNLDDEADAENTGIVGKSGGARRGSDRPMGLDDGSSDSDDESDDGLLSRTQISKTKKEAVSSQDRIIQLYKDSKTKPKKKKKKKHNS